MIQGISATKMDAQQTPEKTIFVIDDDEDQREMVVSLLDSAQYAVQEYDSPATFLAEYKQDQRGCILSDVVMPGMTGLELLNNLALYNISLPVIFMTAHADVSMVKTALKQGASDFLEKPLSTVELLSAIQIAIKQDIQLRSQQDHIELIHSRLDSLTSREREVLDSLVAGQSNKELASQLNISLRTVETHRNHVLKKMGVSTFTELLRTLLSYPDKRKN